MTAFPFGETVQHVTRTVTGRDSRGNDVYTEVTTPYDNVPVAGRGSSVESDNYTHDQVFIGLWIYLPSGVVVSPVDQFIVRGLTYNVDGQPFEEVSPFTGWRPGIAVPIKDVNG